jgi:hypothetical protein
MLMQWLERLRHIDEAGVTEELFAESVIETFTTLSVDGRTVPLKPNGENIDVTFW